jgi:hypothetical protein
VVTFLWIWPDIFKVSSKNEQYELLKHVHTTPNL